MFTKLFLAAFLAITGTLWAEDSEISFERDVRPILKANCFHCHGEDPEPKGKLDVRLTRFLLRGGDSGPVIVPGNRQESYLFERVLKGEMPPGEHKLTAEQIETIGKWVDSGAKTSRTEPETLPFGPTITFEERAYWFFQPIAHPAIPLASPSERVRSPIDAFVLDKLKKNGLEFNPDADKRTYIRRATWDLLGLPPTPQEVAVFLADESPESYEKLIDRLLESPAYGERWARHWLDAAGYADSDGVSEADHTRQFAYKYRDYVIRSFQADKPVDQFLIEQIAGDELIKSPLGNLVPEDIELLTATGFLRLAGDGTSGANTPENRQQVVADTIKIVSSSLLGLSFGCAQCHDHRYDPIPQVDYYRLRAVFEPALDPVQWRTPNERLISLQTEEDRKKIAEVQAEIAPIAEERAKKESEFIKEAFTKELDKFPEGNRPTLRTAFETKDSERNEEQKKLVESNPSLNITPGVLYQYNQTAADELKKYDARIGEIQKKFPPSEYVMALTEPAGHLPPTHVFYRGDSRQPKDQVTPGIPMVGTPEGNPIDLPALDPKPATSGRRLAWAKWLVSRVNPLTPRVLVNRIWMNHFGKGIVDSAGEFGKLGSLPTHPELLDWLANDFIESGFRLKRLHKQIMLSTTYRQSSEIRSELDRDGRLLSHYPIRRLEAEAIRDGMLSVTGILNQKQFGPPIPIKEDEVGQVLGELPIPEPGMDFPADHASVRRSLYFLNRRTQPLSFLRTFDAPVMETNCEYRASSTSALQSLMLLNNPEVLTIAGHLAVRLKKEKPDNRLEQIQLAFQLTYQRDPSPEESQLADAYLTKRIATPNAPFADVEREALTGLCQALLTSNEFLYIE